MEKTGTKRRSSTQKENNNTNRSSRSLRSFNWFRLWKSKFQWWFKYWNRKLVKVKNKYQKVWQVKLLFYQVQLRKKVTPVTIVGPDPGQDLVSDDFLTGLGVTPGEIEANTNISPVVKKPTPPVSTVSDSSLDSLKVTKAISTPPVNSPDPKPKSKKSKISKNPKTNKNISKNPETNKKVTKTRGPPKWKFLEFKLLIEQH